MSRHDRKKIAIIDDDKVFSEILGFGLMKNGYEVSMIGSAADAFKFIGEDKEVDLYIIDFHLGEEEADGLALCRKVKTYAKKPVIMLTGEDSTDVTVSCLYAGADQYIVKPYVLKELLARIHVAMRQSQIAPSGDRAQKKVVFKNLVLNGDAREIEGSHASVRLSERELQLAEIFFGSPEIDITRNQIHLRLFGNSAPAFSRAVDVMVGRLRKKLISVSDEVLILSSRNSGYRLVSRGQTTD